MNQRNIYSISLKLKYTKSNIKKINIILFLLYCTCSFISQTISKKPKTTENLIKQNDIKNNSKKRIPDNMDGIVFNKKFSISEENETFEILNSFTEDINSVRESEEEEESVTETNCKFSKGRNRSNSSEIIEFNMGENDQREDWEEEKEDYDDEVFLEGKEKGRNNELNKKCFTFNNRDSQRYKSEMEEEREKENKDEKIKEENKNNINKKNLEEEYKERKNSEKKSNSPQVVLIFVGILVVLLVLVLLIIYYIFVENKSSFLN